jgi:hypothetical protein
VILYPPIIALVAGSIVVGWVLLFSSAHAVQILRKWDLKSGSELQLGLERKTYLITTILTWAFCFQLISLLLFVYIADDLAKSFVGAMCAAGSLALNGYGYPALILKLGNFLLAGTWLILNFVDNRAPDYPLIKPKYRLLLLLTPLMLAEVLLQCMYFFSLKPDVITSCCGSLFSKEASGFQSVLFAFPRVTMQSAFGVGMLATVATGLWFYLRSRRVSGYLFAFAGSATFGLSVAAFISYMCLYIYELPTHNCPFCVFQGEYGHVGYPLYLCLLGGAVLMVGVGALMPFRRVESLARVLPPIQKGLTLVSLLLYGAFTAIVSYRIAVSDLVL